MVDSQSAEQVSPSQAIDSSRSPGTVRLHDATTKALILLPTPSNDPYDPLNWPQWFRYYIALLVCLAMILCNFLAAGPTVAMVSTAIEFFVEDGSSYTETELDSYVSQVAYFFTTTSLMQGLGNLVWMPFILRYGKRPIYVASFVLYTITAIWVGCARSYTNALVARIVMGFAAGSAECLAPLTIADVFFLHERGTVMAFYTASLNFGCSVGIVLGGLITINLNWRYIYWVSAALIGSLTLVVFLTMPETSFSRDGLSQNTHSPFAMPNAKSAEEHGYLTAPSSRPSRSCGHALRLFHGKQTSEPFWKLCVRPIGVLILPPVLWSTLVMAVTIGFLVAISSNFADAFSETYGFGAWQSRLCFVSGFVGSAIGIVFGGVFSDWVANILTRRNGGIREPEFRLPAMAIGMVTAPIALTLYGVGIEHCWHWTIPTLGLGLLNFSIAQATNVSLCYIVDSYRPIAGETAVTQLAFKSAFGFLLSFYTNPWAEYCGYAEAFGEMAGVAAVVLLFWVPFFIFGKQIRTTSLRWPLTRALEWSEDREVGE